MKRGANPRVDASHEHERGRNGRCTPSGSLFQFDLSDMSLRSSVTGILLELTDVFDDLALALWFAEPNAWLADLPPVEVLPSDPASVLDAARADRFIARG